MGAEEARPVGRQIIERYGPGGFVVAGAVFTGPILILPNETLVWDVISPDCLTPESFQRIAETSGIEILLLGTGPRMKMVPKPVREALRQVGIVVDSMDTGAACRTYSVLLAEERRVAAALFPNRE